MSCVVSYFLLELVFSCDTVHTHMDSNFLTINQVAEKFGVTRLTVVRLIEEGKFKASKFGWQWRIDRTSLEAYFASNSKQNLTNSVE